MSLVQISDIADFCFGSARISLSGTQPSRCKWGRRRSSRMPAPIANWGRCFPWLALWLL